MARRADNYNYDTLQRVTSGPETAGSKTAYSYVNSGGSPPYQSHSTVDQMGIDAMPQPGSAAQLGAEYQGNGELCWVAQVTSSSGTCSNPAGSATNYETVSYNSSGDMTGTAATGYGASSALNWNVDTNQPTCINPAGTSCTGPSASQPQAQTYTYNADGLRMTAGAWNSSSSSVVTSDFTYTGASALLSNGSFDYLYGRNPVVPIGQIDTSDSYSSELLIDRNLNVRGIVEISSGAANAYVLDNYTDYDTYGNPMTQAGGSVNAGGLTVDGKSGDADSATSYGFGGGYEDASGLTYLVHRYYDPNLGQFVSPDPAVTRTHQTYVYATDNPTSSVDPLGLNTVGPCVSAGVAAQSFPFASMFIPGGFDGQVCLARTVNTPHGNDDIGFLLTGGLPKGVFGVEASIDASWIVSNSDWLNHMSGKFTMLYQAGFTQGGEHAALFYAMPHNHLPFTFGVEGGLGFGRGFSVGEWRTDTYVLHIADPVTANILRIWWDINAAPVESQSIQHSILVAGKAALCFLVRKTCNFLVNGK